MPAWYDLPDDVSFVTSAITGRSGTITTGGVSQLLSPANPNRKGILFENTSNGDLWIQRLTSVATMASPSIKISSGVYWEAPLGGCGVNAYYVIGATTGQTFTCEEW